jgi:hypothetical protein
MITDTIFERINDEYSYGQYAEFKVIIMKKNGYINATKLCKEHNKRFDNWLQNINNKELINSINNIIASPGIPGDAKLESIIIITGKLNSLTRGTYVHSLLIPHIASWISPQFAIKISKIINDYIVKEYKVQLIKKDNKINNLNKENIILSQKIDKLINQNKEIIENTNKIIEQNNNLTDTIKRIENKLQNNGANVPGDYKLQEQLILMKKDNIISVIRAQNRSVSKSIKNKESQGFTIIESINNIASTIGTFNVVKDQLFTDKLIRKVDARRYNDFELVSISIDDLIEIISTIHNTCKSLN